MCAMRRRRTFRRSAQSDRALSLVPAINRIGNDAICLVAAFPFLLVHHGQARQRCVTNPEYLGGGSGAGSPRSGRAPIGRARASSRSATGVVQARNAGRPSALAARLSCLCALGCALALSGCAPGSESRSEPTRAMAGSPENSVAQMCRPQRALLVPQPAPDCGFAWSSLKTVDPDQWSRLKVESERKCYQRAEKIVRQRLRLLQASLTCEAATTR